MGHSSQQWSCGDEFAGRLRWHVHACLRQGEQCSIVMFRAVEQPETGCPPPDAARALAYLAERVAPVIRRTDVIEIDGGHALAILLPGTGREGTRAVYQRLRDLLAPPPLPGDTPFVLGLSYATGAEEWDSECALDAALRDACIPRMLVTLGLPEDYRERAWLGSHAPALPRAAERVHFRTDTLAATSVARQAAVSAGRGRHLRLVASGERRLPGDDTLRERARALGVPYVQLPATIPSGCLDALAPELARELEAVVIGRSRTTLTVAMRNPLDMPAVSRLRAATGFDIFPVLASTDALARALNELDLLVEG